MQIGILTTNNCDCCGKQPDYIKKEYAQEWNIATIKDDMPCHMHFNLCGECRFIAQEILIKELLRIKKESGNSIEEGNNPY